MWLIAEMMQVFGRGSHNPTGTMYSIPQLIRRLISPGGLRSHTKNGTKVNVRDGTNNSFKQKTDLPVPSPRQSYNNRRLHYWNTDMHEDVTHDSEVFPNALTARFGLANSDIDAELEILAETEWPDETSEDDGQKKDWN